MSQTGEGRRLPHPALREYVDAYVGYHHVLDDQAVHFGVPSPTATVIIAFDTPLDTQWLGEDASRAQRWTTVAGLGTRTALIRTHGLQHGIQLALSPRGVRALLGRPVGELAHQLVTLADLGLPGSLVDRLSPMGLSERFDTLDAVLLEWVRDRRRRADVPDDLTHAWQRLGRSRGRLQVADLAEEIGWSRRHLQTRFAAEFGIGPKQAARLHRFDHARTLARRGVPLGVVAQRAGYADQAHLGREWRELAAQTPAQALRKEFPIVLDPA